MLVRPIASFMTSPHCATNFPSCHPICKDKYRGSLCRIPPVLAVPWDPLQMSFCSVIGPSSLVRCVPVPDRYEMQTNPEKRTLLPKVAFTGFQARFRPPSLAEGFQEIVKVDFNVSLTSIFILDSCHDTVVPDLFQCPVGHGFMLGQNPRHCWLTAFTVRRHRGAEDDLAEVLALESSVPGHFVIVLGQKRHRTFGRRVSLRSCFRLALGSSMEFCGVCPCNRSRLRISVRVFWALIKTGSSWMKCSYTIRRYQQTGSGSRRFVSLLLPSQNSSTRKTRAT